MVPTTEILRTLIDAGYLKETDTESARPIIAAALQKKNVVAARANALRDEGQQEQMITGAHQYAVNDAFARDKVGLDIDKSIIRDAISKEKQDKGALRRIDRMISSACKSAAKNLAHARLIDKSHLNDVAGLIKNTWIENSS